MAGTTKHGFDRRDWLGTVGLAAIPIVVVVLLATAAGGTIAFRAWRDRAPHSRAGDACGGVGSVAVMAFDQRTGHHEWTNIVPGESQLVRERGQVQVVRKHEARTFDPATGAVTACGPRTDALDLARDDLHVQLPLLVDERKLAPVASGIESLTLTGERRWYRALSEPVAIVDGGLLVNRKAIDDDDPKWGTALIDLTTGKDRWFASHVSIASPVRAGRPVLVASRDRRTLESLQIADGAVRWRRHLDGAFLNGVVQQFGTDLVVPDGAGTAFTVIDANTGRVRWQVRDANPATGRHYSLPGQVTSIVRVPDRHLLLVTVEAWRPEDDFGPD